MDPEKIRDFAELHSLGIKQPEQEVILLPPNLNKVSVSLEHGTWVNLLDSDGHHILKIALFGQLHRSIGQRFVSPTIILIDR